MFGRDFGDDAGFVLANGYFFATLGTKPRYVLHYLMRKRWIEVI